MIQTLNRDLAGEYQTIIAYIVYSQVLTQACYTDIARELEQHAAEDFQHAKQIAKQIDDQGGIQCIRLTTVNTPNEPVAMLLFSILQNVENEIDLASLLGIGEAGTDRFNPENPERPRQTRESPTHRKSVLQNQTCMSTKPAKPHTVKVRARTMPRSA